MADIATAKRPATCLLLRAGEPFVGKQGLTYAPAISAETARASAIHMQLLTMPPCGRAKAHKHEGARDCDLRAERRSRDVVRRTARASHGHLRRRLRLHSR